MTQKTFDADVAQLIQLVTHSIYSNHEIFLRELISNASDALAKAKFQARTDASYLGDDHELHIIIDIDDKKNVLTITDNGIGMTPDEVVENIGTIAKSGTKAFLEKMKDQKKKGNPNDLIGQFGIGFYSVFMVANKVELETKSNESSKATLRTSDGKGSYEISTSKKKKRGTTIRIFLKEDHKEYAEQFKIKSLIQKHSNYVPFPILIPATKDEQKDKKDDIITINKKKYLQANKAQSIRTKKRNEVTPEEYQEFYTSLTFDSEKPLDYLHLEVEGAINYKALLYIPQKTNPFAQMMGNIDEYGPSLYVQNVLISENTKELLPQWLRFIKGVVETPDLPLNVSREILQNNTFMEKIRKSLVKKVIEALRYQMKENKDAYQDFFINYGKVLKEGVHFDRDNKEAIASLGLRNSYKLGKTITLDEYIENMTSSQTEKKQNKKEGKKEKSEKAPIYYLTGTNIAQLRSSPYLEKFSNTDIDVLLLTDPIDDRVVQALPQYKEHKLTNAQHAKITDRDNKKDKDKKEKEEKKINSEHKDLLALIKETIGKDKIDNLEFTTNLTDSVAVLLPKDGAPSPQQERYMKAMGQNVPPSIQDLQLNINHPIIQKMIEIYTSNPKDTNIKNYILYLYHQALLLQGREIENIAEFIKTTNNLIQ